MYCFFIKFSILCSVVRSIAVVQEPHTSRPSKAMMRARLSDEALITIEPSGAMLTKKAPEESQASAVAPQTIEAKPTEASNLAQKNSQAQATEPKKEDQSHIKTPVFSPEIGELAKKAEASMAMAVDQELEGTHAAEKSSERMAEALERTALAAIQETEAYLTKVSENTLKASTDGKEQVEKIVDRTTTSIAGRLDESRQHSTAIVNQLQHAKTQAQMIDSLTAAEQLSKAALEATGKIASDVHDAVGTIKGISKDTSTMMQRAVEDMQTAKRKTVINLTKMSEQLVSVGLAFSSKMAARADAEVIANRLGETADTINKASRDMADKTDISITTLRSTVDQWVETIDAQAVTLQAKGEGVVRELAAGARLSKDAHVNNEGSWMQSEISAVGIVGDAAVHAKDGLAGKAEATHVPETTWYYAKLGYLLLTAVVSVAVYAYFYGKIAE